MVIASENNFFRFAVMFSFAILIVLSISMTSGSRSSR